jgi:WhiB family redox-sensing transcriptional regulator
MMSTDQSDPVAWLAALLRRPEWHRKAACRGIGTDAFFPVVGGNGQAARAVCDTCAVRTKCMASALDHADSVGVWAGTTDRDRKRMRQDVTDPRPEPGAIAG